MIAVTTAYSIEARWIRRGAGVRVVRTPVGERSGEVMDDLVGSETPVVLVASGFCGGLAAGLRVGDLVLSDVIRHRGEEIVVDAEILDRARRALERDGHPCRLGPCASVAGVADLGTKRKLARSGAVSVDMESGPLAGWAKRRNVPFVSLRAVLDPIDIHLPFSIEEPVVISVFRHPISALRAGRAATRAGRALGRALNDLIPALEEAMTRRPVPEEGP